MISLSWERNRVEMPETMLEKISRAKIIIQAISNILRLRIIPSSFWP